MRRTLGLLLAGLFGIGAAPLGAHHSYDAEFDRNKPVQFEGTVSRLEWKNPHAYLYVDVEDESGEPVTWELQLGGPPALAGSLGWTRSTLAAGDHVVIDGFAARQGQASGVARTVTIPSGEVLEATIGLQDRGGRGGRGSRGFGPPPFEE